MVIKVWLGGKLTIHSEPLSMVPALVLTDEKLEVLLRGGDRAYFVDIVDKVAGKKLAEYRMLVEAS